MIEYLCELFKPENIGGTISCFASLGTCLYVFLVVKQTKLMQQQLESSRNEFLTSIDYSTRKKAIELAEVYANDIINKLCNIEYIFKKIEIEKVIHSKLKSNELVQFDIHELKTLLSETDIDMLNKKLESVDENTIYYCRLRTGELSKDEAYDRQLLMSFRKLKSINESKNNGKCNFDEVFEQLKCEKYSKEEILNLNIYYSIIDDNYVNSLISDTLNQLEAFCMYFNQGVADDETVYQSLHQLFLGTVKLLYFKIASNNIVGKDKFYTNIIKMYNRWNKEYIKQSEQQIESMRKGVLNKEKIEKPA